MIEVFAAIIFIGILAHVIKSWYDWAEVRNTFDLMPILDVYTNEMSKNFEPCIGFVEST